MIRTLLLLSVCSLGLSTPSFAGKDPCKGVKTDGVARHFHANELTWWTDGEQRQLVLGLSKSVGFMAVLRKKTEDELPDLPAGSAVTIHLADGTTVPMVTESATPPSVYVLMGALINRYLTTYTLTEEMWKKLASQPITMVTLDSDQEYQITPNNKDGAKFSQAGQCILGS